MKRKSAKLHGQSEFDIYANPVMSANGDTVLYNGYATFIDGKSEFTYSLVDGAAYLSTKNKNNAVTTRCLPPNTLPFDNILPALNDVTPIPSASIGKEAVECTSGNLFKTSFAGANYAICASSKAGFQAYSSDLDIAVEYLDAHVSISKPKLTDGSISCKPVEKAVSLTPTALALATGDKIPSSVTRKLKSASHMAMQARDCSECPSKPRPCIFLHGLGNPNDEAALFDTPALTKNKFGDIGDHATCCSTVKYAVVNTNDAGWRNDTLQQRYCDLSLSMSSTSDRAAGIIDNTIIVTHSMGGLVIAGALAKGKCRFSKTTSWVALSTPGTGSMASDYLIEICHEGNEVASELFELFGQCPMPKSRKSCTYQGGKHTSPSIDAAYVAAQAAYRGNVTAAMCSDSFFGLFSSYQASCIFAGTVVPHKSKKNDALVEYQSCLAGLDDGWFGNDYMDRFYRPQLNHADTAFLNGDGLFRDSQKPMKWFECLQL
ncbi:hypothetical protein PHPALM_17102 [Phytophthora palmivora]|uniref:Uncharacterized protein n=1 Tax=Phytophthora palmivora TaxID=4796 RepID=A0A2P4XN33_9STRA|nr:hypothetical protein PHPALM_17102 [Phytophthora palmivora]